MASNISDTSRKHLDEIASKINKILEEEGLKENQVSGEGLLQALLNGDAHEKYEKEVHRMKEIMYYHRGEGGS